MQTEFQKSMHEIDLQYFVQSNQLTLSIEKKKKKEKEPRKRKKSLQVPAKMINPDSPMHFKHMRELKRITTELAT